MRLTEATGTTEILREIGDRLQSYRLQQNLRAADLGARAGVSARTVSRAEAGENTSLESLVKILRALGRLDVLDAFLPVPLVSPLQLAEFRGRERRRASVKRTTGDG